MPSNEVSFLPIDFVWKGLTITKAAAKQIDKIVQQDVKNKGLRISIKQYGCAGFGYAIEIVKKINDNDLQFSQFGINLFVSLQMMPFIDGTKVDYVREGLNESFKFNNPKAQHTCGCGESFNIE